MTPNQILSPFVVTLAISFLIGIGLREYYEGEQKFDTFGTVRTFVFIGMLGFVLFQLPEIGRYAYLAGFAALSVFLAIYYLNKLEQKKSPGMIGILIGLLTYAAGPITLLEPPWFLVLMAISVLFVLHSKGRIRRFTDRLETGEVVTVCKFLAIAGVALPLIPSRPEHPLELTTALVFALMFAIIAFLTKYTLEVFRDLGLLVLSFVVGFSDITPFVVSVLQGNLGIRDQQIVQAIIIASASNNVLKTIYTWGFGSRRTAALVTPVMATVAAASILYAVFGL